MNLNTFYGFMPIWSNDYKKALEIIKYSTNDFFVLGEDSLFYSPLYVKVRIIYEI